MSNRLEAFATRPYKDRDGNEKTAYTRIGTAFETRNGWAIRLDALPLPSMGERGLETTILLMPPKEDSQPRQQGRSAPQFDSPGDDSVPF